MANTFKINFDDVYDINTTSCEMRSASFDAKLIDGSKKVMVAINDQALNSYVCQIHRSSDIFN